MNATQRNLLAISLGAVVSLLVASCGESETGVTTVGTDSTAAPRRFIEHPADADTAIVRIAAGQPHPGSIPNLVIGGDGKLYQPGEAPGGIGGGAHGIAPPQPGAQPVIVRQLSPEGMQRVLERADELGLLAAPPTYDDPGVTDSSSTYVRLNIDEGTFDHEAYALGFDDPEIDDDRQRLADFVDDLDEIDDLVGRDNVGRATQYVPARWSVASGSAYPPFDDPLLWPEGIDVEEGCVALDVAEYPDGVAGRYVAGAGTKSEQLIAVAPDLPGDDC